MGWKPRKLVAVHHIGGGWGEDAGKVSCKAVSLSGIILNPKYLIGQTEYYEISAESPKIKFALPLESHGFFNYDSSKKVGIEGKELEVLITLSNCWLDESGRMAPKCSSVSRTEKIHVYSLPHEEAVQSSHLDDGMIGRKFLRVAPEEEAHSDYNAQDIGIFAHFLRWLGN